MAVRRPPFSPERLRQARLHQGWTQHDLAYHLGTRERHVGRWEQGTHEPRRATVRKIGVLLGLPTEYFYPADDEEESAWAPIASTR